MPDLEHAALDDDIGDEWLRLIFTACHPLLPRQARAALALRMQLRPDHRRDRARLPGRRGNHRPAHSPHAKRTLSRSGLSYEIPGRQRRFRSVSPSVLEVRLSSSQQELFGLRRRGVAASRSSATRLHGAGAGRARAPRPEVHGLMALDGAGMPRGSRRAPASMASPSCMDQDRPAFCWSRRQIGGGLRALDRARELGGAGRFLHAAGHGSSRVHATAETSRCHRLAQHCGTLWPACGAGVRLAG